MGFFQNLMLGKKCHDEDVMLGKKYHVDMRCPMEEEEEEEEDLFVFNDTIEGPRAPAVKPGRVTQA